MAKLISEVEKNPNREHSQLAPVTILNLYKILFENTDENNGLNAMQIMDALEKKKTPLGRTALLKYIGALDDYLFPDADESIFEGIGDDETPNCIKRPGHGHGDGYRLIVRNFKYSEVKFLADAVAASRSISQETAENLIGKLMTLLSKEQAKELKRQLCIDERPRPFDEYLLTNISEISSAIDEVHEEINDNYRGKIKVRDKYRSKIKFKYYEYGTKQELIEVGDFVCSPYALAWINDRYCLIASHPESGIATYYVDQMDNVETVKKKVEKGSKVKLVEEKADDFPAEFNVKNSITPKFNLPKYLNTTQFSFGSEKNDVVDLEVDKSIVNNVVKKLEYKAKVIQTKNKDNVKIKINVDRDNLEPFFAWLTGFGTKIRIVNSDELKEKYLEYLKNIIDANK